MSISQPEAGHGRQQRAPLPLSEVELALTAQLVVAWAGEAGDLMYRLREVPFTGSLLDNPAARWQPEPKLSDEQGAELRILEPDEHEARAAFEAAHPERVHARADLLASPETRIDLFGDDADDSDLALDTTDPEDDEEAA